MQHVLTSRPPTEESLPHATPTRPTAWRAGSQRSRGKHGRLRTWLLAAVLGATAVLAALPARAQCVDEELKEQLIGRRAYRGVVPRVFKKALRHEVSALGGWYAADLSDGRPTYGGA